MNGYTFLGDLTGFSFDESGASPFVEGDWFQLAKSGTFFSPVYGKVTISPQDLRTMERNFRDVTPKAPTQLPIDYDHKSDNPEMHAAGDAKAAGWVEDLELRYNDTELWCLPKWTRPAAKMIAAGEYRFVSPYFLTNYLDKSSGKKVGPTLKAVAITNRPFLEGMQEIPAPAIAASETAQREFRSDKRVAIPVRRNVAISRALAQGRVDMPEEKKKEEEKKAKEEKEKAIKASDADGDDDGDEMDEQDGDGPGLTCPHCGAAVSNDGSHAKKAAGGGGDEMIDKLKDALGVGKEKPAASDKKVADPDAAKPDDKKEEVEMTENEKKLQDEIRQLREKDEETTKALKELQLREKTKVSQDLIARALKEGKVTPKMVGEKDKPGWAMAFADRDADGFTKWLEDAPVIVSFGEKGTGDESAANSAGSTAIEIDKLAAVKMSENTKLRYADAVKTVLAENRALAESYDKQMIGERSSAAAVTSNIRRL